MKELLRRSEGLVRSPSVADRISERCRNGDIAFRPELKAAEPFCGATLSSPFSPLQA